MAKEAKVWEVIKNAGYEPINDRCIVVSYASANLSEKIAKFFTYSCKDKFYAFQMCTNEVVLVPFSNLTWDLKKEVALAIPYDSIKSVQVVEDGLNYNIKINIEDEEIVLTAQQKELSALRSAGTLAGGIDFSKNWHKANLDDTLEALRNIASI